MQDLNDTLQERGERYGSFRTHALISQSILDAMKDSPNWDKLEPYMREALHIITNKLGRILNGDPYYDDSWHDIAGYSELVAKILNPDSKEV